MDSLVERKRRLIQADVAVVALRMFREKGYEETSVDDLAKAVGMSRRTFFRYFRSKDDVVAGKWSVMTDSFLAALAQRPAGEPAWTSLRRALDPIVEHYADPARRADSYALDQTVATIPALHSSFLDHIDTACIQAAGILTEQGVPPLEADMMARTCGAALITAMDHSRQQNTPSIQKHLDHAFTIIHTPTTTH